MNELDHPNVCRLLESYDDKTSMYFVMEYCAGKDLLLRIVETSGIEERTSADIVRQVASALRHAHGKGIAHRDVKPENVVFCSDDVTCNDVKVIDWGIGFFFERASMHSSVGTSMYMAPEVAQASVRKASVRTGYTCACDAFGLGVMTYVMLAGKKPFWGNTRAELYSKLQEEYPMSGKDWDSASDVAKDFVQSLLRSDPAKRLTMDGALEHPWLKGAAQKTEQAVSCRVFMNLRTFCNKSRLVPICMASIARQLDHRSLKDVHQVFKDLDTNCDGVLDLNEMQNGARAILGSNCNELGDIREMFQKIDLDNSGEIGYTEFCMAGMGTHNVIEEDVLWAAFKAFDVRGDSKPTKTEFLHVLGNAGLLNDLSNEQVCKEAFDELDKDRSGDIDFQEWVEFVHMTTTQCSKQVRALESN